MKRNSALVIVLTTILAISLCSVIALAKGKPDKPSVPEVATFSITFTTGDILINSFETEANTENWKPQNVKGRIIKSWAIDSYSIAEFFTLYDVHLDPKEPDPLFGLIEYPEDSSVCDFFDVSKLITISWLEHAYTKENDWWSVALNQTDYAGHNYVLVMDNWVSGTESYDETQDQWTVIFEDASCHIQWWADGVFHNVWKGRLTFTVTVQRFL